MTESGFRETGFSSMDERSINQFETYKATVEKLFSIPEISFVLSDCNKQQPSHEVIKSKIKASERHLSNALDFLEAMSKLGVIQSAAEIFSGLDNANKFAVKITEVESIRKKHLQLSDSIRQELSSLGQHFEVAPSWINSDITEALNAVNQLIQKVADCETIDRIELMSEHLGDKYNLPSFRTLVLPKVLPIKESWGDRVKREICRIWYDEVRSSHIQLRTFDRKLFEETVYEFRNAEATHSEAARDTVNDQLARRWTSKAPDHKAIALLKKESTKQRRFLYPREVMEKGALETMLRLKPCWLMSPLSVSQILPLIKGMFDVIVFDEASQVRVEDAIPAIYRASTMVVVGDPKQMPPTNFFLGGGADEPDEDEEEETELSESILDLAANIYPAQMLEWHYRSRSESLIAFSNRAFYGGRLIAAPNPTSLGQDDSLSFISVEGGTFSQKQGNSVEAEVVVNHLENILMENPNQSVGIIAMGQSQRIALDQALERRMENDKVFAAAVKTAESRTEGEAQVGLFIKNLENVQGDERDIILISVGYAPSKPGKKVHLNFGPLSKKGGGRRLNVAITRARSKVVVFSSFSPDAIPTDESAFNSNPDTTCFGRYLKYVKAISSGRIDEATAILDSFGVAGVLTKRSSSNFSRDVARRLRERGFDVSLEVGSSGFFIDVAVHHPTIQRNFILGIECDGAMFHSTQYARDRDKAREALLTARGWRIVRVWGPDWSRSWKSEIDRIEQIINEINKKNGPEALPSSVACAG